MGNAWIYQLSTAPDACYSSHVLRWFALSAVLLAASVARAQADLPDAGLPDASVGGTGAERASEEEEDSTSNPCLSDRDCDRGLQCVNSKCTWRRYRDATFEGCDHTAELMLAAALLLLTRRPSSS
jgi:hypothetical protein